MTLRDLGTWFGDLWSSLLEGLNVALTQSFWDWPLWISIPTVIIVPWIVIAIARAGLKEIRDGQRDPIGWTIGFGVLTFLCLLTTYDLWVTQTVFQDGEKNTAWLQVAYPIMSSFFGFYFLISIQKRRRK